MPGIFPEPGRMPLGVHMGGGNFGFVDGHAETNNIRPFQEYWLATGGATTVQDPGCVPEPRGNFAHTYPPTLNVADLVASAEWWVVPWYPDAPLFSPGTGNWPYN